MDFEFKKPVIFGFGGGFLLLGFYFLFLTLANSFSHAVSQFWQIWYWILILAIGFGTQVGLYVFIRERIKTASGKILAASGGISTGSMIVCCLHHLADILPFLGIAALAVFLTQYQIFFIILGILANFIGIIIMLEIIKKHQYLGLIKKIAVGASLPVLFITFLLISNQPETTVSATNLPSRIDSQSGITFEVSPIEFSLTNPVKFEIKIDTHSGSLDFDLAKISFLEDGKGNEHQPLGWQGSPSGGHHLEGVLIFPPLTVGVKSIELNIMDIYGVAERKFYWELK